MHESLRPVRPVRRNEIEPPARRKSRGRLIVGVLVVLMLVVSMFSFGKGTAASEGSAIHSGFAGKCLDVQHNSADDGAVVQLWSCNKSAAQEWTIGFDAIRHGDDRCLSVEKNATKVSSPVVLEPCTSAPGQLWLRDRTGYYNPHSQLCLMVPDSKAGTNVILASCKDLASNAKTWQPEVMASTCPETKSERLACEAVTEWSAWQNSSNHLLLLDKYTGGAPYEAWCADFVSYIYRQAGHAFTQGANNGWDESIAENIQNMGFSKHYADTGYVPKAGDVAYFDYAGGHVELVVSGGKTPTFVYGNSGKTDPTTGNGDMGANTITNDQNGNVVYYLSPNSL